MKPDMGILMWLKAGVRRMSEEGRRSVSIRDEPPAADHLEDGSDAPSAAALEAALRVAPRGAFALAGIALAILIGCWLIVYFLVLLPRGAVG